MELFVSSPFRGTSEDFDTLWREYGAQALRFATAITRSPELAADALQETMIRAFRAADKYDPSRPFKPWFDSILVNECRRALKITPLFVDIEAVAEPADEHDDTQYDDLREAIGELPPKYRELVLLFYMQGYSEAETAQITGLKPQTVKSRLYEARQALKAKLSKEGVCNG